MNEKKKRNHPPGLHRLLRIQRRHRRGVVDLDAAPLLLVAVPEGQLPAALVLRRREPEAHQVPAGRGGRVVGVRRAGVQDVRVGQELDVADVEDHVQREAVAGGLEDLEGLQLGGGQGWDDALVGEAGQGADVVGVPP